MNQFPQNHMHPRQKLEHTGCPLSQDQENDAREESLELKKHCSSGKCCHLNIMVKREEEKGGEGREEEEKEKKEGEEE